MLAQRLRPNADPSALGPACAGTAQARVTRRARSVARASILLLAVCGGEAVGSAWRRRFLVVRHPLAPVGGDPCGHWGKSGLMGVVLVGPGGAFGPVAIRCLFFQAGQREMRRAVRKHPAPSGALRPSAVSRLSRSSLSQEAPSTIRCIETALSPLDKLRAKVRKRPAPSGALRRESIHFLRGEVKRQEAPSTIRCIETLCRDPESTRSTGQEAPSTTGRGPWARHRPRGRSG